MEEGQILKVFFGINKRREKQKSDLFICLLLLMLNKRGECHVV